MTFQCKSCENPLVLDIESGSGSEGDNEGEDTTIPDDLQLPCGCHFHWQCLLDESSDVAISLKCPSCRAYLPVNQPGRSTTNTFVPSPQGTVISTRYVSEGGTEDSLDILPTIIEEAYLAAHPEARPARAFHLMCAEGDVTGIVELLQDVGQEFGGELVQLGHVIRYRDPLDSGKTGLHLAIDRGQEAMVWLLLWLASPLPTDAFPRSAHEVVQSLQIRRLDMVGDDIRALRTEDGRSPEDFARARPSQWDTVLHSGVLRP